jgi:endonuclease/exonuclease/phosphatase family metal-dependent hydrolase
MPKKKLTILCWNILANVFAECKDYKDLNCSDLAIAKRRSKIHYYIVEYDPDIILLQEVEQKEALQLEQSFTLYSVIFIPHRDDHWKTLKRQHPNGNAIMIKNKKITNKIKIKTHQLHKNGNRSPIVEFQIGNHNIIVSSIHLDDINAKLRHSQMASITNKIEKIASSYKNNKCIMIIGGDTNDSSADIDTYMLSKKFNMSTPHVTYLEQKPMSLDHIYVKNTDILNTYVPTSTAASIIKEYGSDHLPVTISVQLEM